ncbi:hypothetical protein [Streptomyces cavernicola]|uniref:Uncharacterized protein n=1 Tax=Streptomyces cavernicola TaxID=3043613 RepID=A0ABT6SG50_9ACTN|nr:hypothetical protein [Streptomyces sp. B-S-A6]MDI3406403.1 hypothetical protein [Streptomyces sp. B-S-A6]
MELTEQYSDYLETFQDITRAQVRETLHSGNLGTLKEFGIREDNSGVWAKIVIEVHGAEKIYRRRILVIDAEDHPPEDPAEFAATLFSTNVVQEELEIPELRQRWVQGE